MSELRAKVLSYMSHRPCGEHIPNSPCMEVDHKTRITMCSKNYPQPFRDVFMVNDATGRAEYRRPDNGVTAVVGHGSSQQIVDNRWTVPYNPYLLMKYDCHICVDLVTSSSCGKYLYKYVHKGPDFTRACIECDGNEIEAYRSVRYVSASEAMWHIFGYNMSAREPTVQLLPVHLEHEQVVLIDEDEELAYNQSVAEHKVTDLMRYFSRPDSDEFDGLTYLDYFEQYTVNKPKANQHCECKDKYNNKILKRKKKCVARMHHINPNRGEVWYLRLLLYHKPALA
jgi:hypothetical protein